jgi:hypothetical protein
VTTGHKDWGAILDVFQMDKEIQLEGEKRREKVIRKEMNKVLVVYLFYDQVLIQSYFPYRMAVIKRN